MIGTAERASESARADPVWRIRKNVADGLLSCLLWLSFAAVLYALSFPVTTPTFATPYLLLILYYSRLYYHLLTVPMWAGNTRRLLAKSRQVRAVVFEGAPRFVVLIAAYKAQSSVVPVLGALKHQRYPRDRFDVYVITQEAENTEKSQHFEAVKNEIEGVFARPEEPRRGSETDIRMLSEMIKSAGRGSADLATELKATVAACLCLHKGRRYILNRVANAVLLEYFRYHHERRPPAEFLARLQDMGVLLTPREMRFLEFSAEKCLGAADRVLRDFSRILGLPEGASIFPDPAKPLRVAKTMAGERFNVAWRHAWVRRALRKGLHGFVARVERELEGMLAATALLPDWSARLRRAYNEVEATCPEVVERAVRAMGIPAFHHICRSKVGGGKPESLNTAYFHLLVKNPGLLSEDTFFVVIDADSLLHSSSLAVIADEIRNDPDRNAIRQMAPLSTSNYAGNNVFVKMIGCLDTIGSMGKWARNTRTQERPDLPAGSGLVIPAVLLEHWRRTKGTPWEARTITEDARMVITDFGLLDGASRKTKFVPIHMLEAVPEGQGVFQTFRQYWVQRMRWASGGPEEIVELVKAFRSDKVYVQSNSSTGEFIARRPAALRRVRARLRQLRLLLGWLTDHLWWGIGYSLAPAAWLAFSFFYITPAALKIAGLCLLLGSPAWVIFGVFSRFSGFVPGGLSVQGLCRLYLGTIPLAWFHTWPIIYTQCLYLLGKRNRFRTWTTTAKPHF